MINLAILAIIILLSIKYEAVFVDCLSCIIVFNNNEAIFHNASIFTLITRLYNIKKYQLKAQKIKAGIIVFTNKFKFSPINLGIKYLVFQPSLQPFHCWLIATNGNRDARFYRKKNHLRKV